MTRPRKTLHPRARRLVILKDTSARSVCREPLLIVEPDGPQLVEVIKEACDSLTSLARISMCYRSPGTRPSNIFGEQVAATVPSRSQEVWNQQIWGTFLTLRANVCRQRANASASTISTRAAPVGDMSWPHSRASVAFQGSMLLRFKSSVVHDSSFCPYPDNQDVMSDQT